MDDAVTIGKALRKAVEDRAQEIAKAAISEAMGAIRAEVTKRAVEAAQEAIDKAAAAAVMAEGAMKAKVEAMATDVAAVREALAAITKAVEASDLPRIQAAVSENRAADRRASMERVGIFKAAEDAAGAADRAEIAATAVLNSLEAAEGFAQTLAGRLEQLARDAVAAERMEREEA